MSDERHILTVGEHLRLVLGEIRPRVSLFTHSLFAMDARGRPDLFASSVLFECDGVPILVTAAHAIAEINRRGSPVHIGAGQIHPLQTQFFLSSTANGDCLDIAVTIVPREFIEAAQMTIVAYERTTVGRPFQNPHLRCVHGFPCSKNKQVKRADPVNRAFTAYDFMYAGASGIGAAEYSEFGKDLAQHVALRYQSAARDENGAAVTPPSPKGMSGGGLWVLPDSAVPTNFYLEGIAIEYHAKRSLVFATRIESVIDFARRTLLPSA